jgi:membrane-bound lytic murein transglycosylase F
MTLSRFAIILFITVFPGSSSFGDPEALFCEGDHGFYIKDFNGFKDSLESPKVDQTEDIEKKIETTLPEYIQHFKKAAQIYKLPWQLLAAIAYEESAWSPDAKSVTGVIGFMQITKETALFLGIKDRLNVKENIFAGAKYLRFLLHRMPRSLPLKERLSLALVAWNIGLGHLADAKKLARERKLNPNRWSSLKKVLPLLADEDISKKLKYGKARGLEPVHFVSRVMQYYQFLLTVDLSST